MTCLFNKKECINKVFDKLKKKKVLVILILFVVFVLLSLKFEFVDYTFWVPAIALILNFLVLLFF